jgi:hypothetical protein
MTNLENSIRQNMTRLDMTREEVIEMMENQGRNDGRNSATFQNPIHNNWPEGAHFNQHYERGYWEGFNN